MEEGIGGAGRKARKTKSLDELCGESMSKI